MVRAFIESAASQIARMTTAGLVSDEFPVSGGARAISAGPDGAIWFTTSAAIGRVTVAGVITVYSVPAAGSSPQGIAIGPDGALWFTDSGTNTVGRITTTGAITEFPLPTTSPVTTSPGAIVAGPDGALWFTTSGCILIVATECTGQIGRITTSGDVTEYSATGGTSGQIQGIAVGSDGGLWFAANFFSCPFRGFICTGGAQIGRITTAGDLTILVPPTSDGSPLGIAAGPDVRFGSQNKRTILEG
jgi:virginiamycin B lyase